MYEYRVKSPLKESSNLLACSEEQMRDIRGREIAMVFQESDDRADPPVCHSGLAYRGTD
jgi:ABC-type microcin C transport system duplicated ATPase subunit YejF